MVGENRLEFSKLPSLDAVLPAVFIVLLSVVLAKLAYYLLEHFIRRMTQKTKTILDDLLLDALELPVVSGVVLAGLFFASVLGGFGDAPAATVLFKIALILWAAVTAFRSVSAVLRWYVQEMAPRYHQSLTDLEPLFRRLAGLFVASISAIMILDSLGVEVSPLIASLGIAGLAVALAFQDTLANFFAGVYLSMDRPLKPGDYIALESGQNGYVVKVGWRSTAIRMLANNILYIPNSKLASTIITNYYSPEKEMAVIVPVSVSYDSDLARVERVVVGVGKRIQQTVKGAVVSFDPFIRYNKFDESGVNFSVILRVDEFVDQYLVTHEFIKALHARFKEEGIEIPYPKRSVYIESKKDGTSRSIGGRGTPFKNRRRPRA